MRNDHFNPSPPQCVSSDSQRVSLHEMHGNTTKKGHTKVLAHH